MADLVFNAAKGKAAEKVADASTSVGVALFKTTESDAALKDRLTMSTVVANNTECDFTNYARKTGLTGTVTVDTTNDRTDVSVPNQTWTTAGGATNNTISRLIVFLDEGGTDGTRIPLVALDFVVTTDSSDLTAQFNASGFYRAS